MKNQPSDRRQFLKIGAGALGGLIFSGRAAKALEAASCILTPTQTAGPFYPGAAQFSFDNDLTLIAGRSKRAEGQMIYISGRVLGKNCEPVAGATVEIWQACATGRYNNSKDPNPALLDPNFKYWGETVTDENGKYHFKTIIPGAYPADEGWTRPPHIHYKVSKLGYRELITQMYFKGNALNDQDLILQDIPQLERESVIVDFKKAGVGFEPDALAGVFDITLKPVR